MGDTIQGGDGGQRSEQSSTGQSTTSKSTGKSSTSERYGAVFLIDPPAADQATPVEFEGIFLSTPWQADELKINLAAALNQSRQDWEPIKGSKDADRVMPAKAIGSLVHQLQHLGAAEPTSTSMLGLSSNAPLVDESEPCTVIDVMHGRIWDTTVEDVRNVRDTTFGESFDQYVRAYHQDKVRN